MIDPNSHIGGGETSWTVLRKCKPRVYNTKNGKVTVEFVTAKCRCGTIKEVNHNNIIKGLSKSCGCIGRAKTVARSTKHGYATRKNWTKEHKIWCGIFKRCYDKNDLAYHRYGGAGIIVCERWHDFKNFIDDMGLIPPGKTSIDRYPNKNGNYEPGNCRWADDFEQSNNRSNNVIVTVNGEKMTAAQAGRILGIDKDTIQARIKYLGWTPEEAIMPVGYRRKNKNKCLIK